MSYFLVFLIAIVLFGVYAYNKLISLRQSVTEAWSDIDVQLERRHSLIPNLVEVVKGYAKHEENLLTQVTQIRARALTLQKNDVAGKSVVEKDVKEKTNALIALAESYPDLKANEQFLNLQKQLSETEDQIASARRIYNANTADYNTAIGTFPTNMIASFGNFTPASFFSDESTDIATTPQIKL